LLSRAHHRSRARDRYLKPAIALELSVALGETGHFAPCPGVLVSPHFPASLRQHCCRGSRLLSLAPSCSLALSRARAHSLLSHSLAPLPSLASSPPRSSLLLPCSARTKLLGALPPSNPARCPRSFRDMVAGVTMRAASPRFSSSRRDAIVDATLCSGYRVDLASRLFHIIAGELRTVVERGYHTPGDEHAAFLWELLRIFSRRNRENPRFLFDGTQTHPQHRNTSRSRLPHLIARCRRRRRYCRRALALNGYEGLLQQQLSALGSRALPHAHTKSYLNYHTDPNFSLTHALSRDLSISLSPSLCSPPSHQQRRLQPLAQPPDPRLSATERPADPRALLVVLELARDLAARHHTLQLRLRCRPAGGTRSAPRAYVCRHLDRHRRSRSRSRGRSRASRSSHDARRPSRARVRSCRTLASCRPGRSSHQQQQYHCRTVAAL